MWAIQLAFLTFCLISAHILFSIYERIVRSICRSSVEREMIGSWSQLFQLSHFQLIIGSRGEGMVLHKFCMLTHPFACLHIPVPKPGSDTRLWPGIRSQPGDPCDRRQGPLLIGKRILVSYIDPPLKTSLFLSQVHGCGILSNPGLWQLLVRVGLICHKASLMRECYWNLAGTMFIFHLSMFWFQSKS